MGNRIHRRAGHTGFSGKIALGLLVFLVCGVFASAAIAGSGTSASDQYDNGTAIQPAKAAKPAAVVTVVKTNVSTTPTATTSKSGALPFTGVSLLSVAVFGGALVAVGFALRRRDRNEES